MITTIYHYSGQTFPGAEVTVYPEGTESIDITDSEITIQLRKDTKAATTATYEMTVGNGITISDSNTFFIDEQVIDIDAGLYYSDIEITLSTGYKAILQELKWVIKATT